MSVFRPLSVALGRIFRIGTSDVLDLSNPVNAQTGTTYTFALTDASSPTSLTNASAIAATIPPHSSVAIPVGGFLIVIQGGAGQVTITRGAGVTLKSDTQGSGDQIMSGLGSVTVLRQIATDSWIASGGLFVASNVIARDMTVNDITNTAAKTTLWSFSIPASKLGTDKQLAIELDGDFLMNASAGTRTFTMEFKLGATVVFGDVSATETQNGTRRPWRIRLKIGNVGGVTNSQYVSGEVRMGSSTVGSLGGIGDFAAIVSATTGLLCDFNGSAAEDSTTALTFTISLTWGSAASTLSFRRQQAEAYLLGEGQKGDTGPQGIAGITGTGSGTWPTSPNSPQSGNYTLAASDIGCRLAASTGTTQTITVPNQSTLAMTDGQTFGIHVSSTGVVTVAGGLGVTLHPSSIVSARQDGVIWVTRMDVSNNFLVTGDYA